MQANIIQNGKTGLFGLTQGQTARISVLNNSAGRVGIIVPCTRVFDLAGNVIAEYEGRALGVGEGMFFDFDATSRTPGAGARMQVRVEVELEAGPIPDDGRPARIKPEDVILTLEIFDNATGKTMSTQPFVFDRHRE